MSDSQDRDQLTVIAVAGSEPEAELIRQRLEATGIWTIAQRAIGGPEWGDSGSRYVYVRASDEADARRILAGPGSSEGQRE